MPAELPPSPYTVAMVRGLARRTSPTFHGASTPKAVREALTAARKAAADHAARSAERERAAAALEETSRTAAAADRAAVEAGTDVGEDTLRAAEEADRIAARTASAAAAIASERAVDLGRVIAAHAEEWLPVLLAEAREVDSERRAPGFTVSASYLAALDLAWERYWTVRTIGEGGRAPTYAHERRDRALSLLAEVDAVLDDYVATLERVDRHREEVEAWERAEAARRAKADAQQEREREIRRRKREEAPRGEVIR